MQLPYLVGELFGIWCDVETSLRLQAGGGSLLPRWAGGVYCRGGLCVGGSLLRRSLGTWSIVRSSLGRVGKLVAGESLLSMMWLLLTI
ncbi:hypothetical protein [Paenibacillus odorifer]|uniref:hypothetical protein n=1 Tax=Paenibacillus odorifer TaxID=189426 RepID=UPI0019551E25|nr:hypothetical protein [Paenibacillus odorifer]